MGTEKHYDLFPVWKHCVLIRHIHIILQRTAFGENCIKRPFSQEQYANGGTARGKTNPAANGLSRLPVFCAPMPISNLVALSAHADNCTRLEKKPNKKQEAGCV